MNAEESLPPDFSFVEPQPQQFGLFELFAIITGSAILCCLAVPLVRILTWQAWFISSVLLVVQFSSVAIAVAWAASARKRRLQVYGRRIGLGIQCGWIGTLSRLVHIMAIVGFVVVEMGIAYFVLSSGREELSILSLWDHAQMGLLGGALLLPLRRIREVGKIEIFESGVHFLMQRNWPSTRVCPSEAYPGAIEVRLHPEPRYESGLICTIYVSDPLKQYLLQHHGLKTEADA